LTVSDTSPVLNLSRIGQLDLLRLLYDRVAIPPAVNAELIRSGVDVSPLTWLSVANAKDRNRVSQFQRDLDAGEAEAIVLALECRADPLLMDERRGRRMATEAGIRVTGLLGILAKAKEGGLISRVKPALDDLIPVARFWIGPKLYAGSSRSYAKSNRKPIILRVKKAGLAYEFWRSRHSSQHNAFASKALTLWVAQDRRSPVYIVMRRGPIQFGAKLGLFVRKKVFASRSGHQSQEQTYSDSRPLPLRSFRPVPRVALHVEPRLTFTSSSRSIK
jgi:predicted nucleic acid-binding protein